MATIIAEPADLGVGELNPSTENYFRVLVYKMAQDDAGIKTLGLADWKTYLSYNGVAVDNVATFVGIDVNTYNYKSTTHEDLPANYPSVMQRFSNLVANTGVPDNTTQPETPNLLQRTITLEGYVKDGYSQGSTHYDGLLDRVTNLETSVGPGGGGGSGDNLSGRVSALEQTVDNPTNGLSKRVVDIENDIGVYNTSKGTVEERLTYLKDKVGDDGSGETTKSGLIKQTDELETKTGCGSTYTDTNSLAARTSALETNTGVGIGTGYDVATEHTLLKRIQDVESAAGAAYHYVGTIIGVVNDSVTEPSVTVELIPETGSNIIIANLNATNNGEVYNIKPDGEAKYLEIIYPAGNTMKLQDGANIAWVWDGSSGHFDELGGSIDVQAIETHLSNLDGSVETITSNLSSDEERLEDLESKFKNNGSATTVWNSHTENLQGAYLVTGRKPPTSGQGDINAKLESFIGYFSTGGYCYVRNELGTLSGDVFNFNDGQGGDYHVETRSTNIQVFITQLG